MNFESFRQNATLRQKPIRQKIRNAHTQAKRQTVVAIVLALPFMGAFFYMVQSWVRFRQIPDLNCVTVFSGLLLFAGILALTRAEEQLENFKAIEARLSKAHEDIYTLEQIIKRTEPFVLYLRGFQSGRQRQQKTSQGTIAHPLTWPTQFGNATTGTVLSNIEKHLPVVLFDNRGERTEFLVGLTIYADDSGWEEDFKSLAAMAKYVVVDIRSDNLFSKGVQQELTYLSQLSSRKVILIGTELDLSAIEKHYPALNQQSVLICKTPDNIERDAENLSLRELDAFLKDTASGNVK